MKYLTKSSPCSLEWPWKTMPKNGHCFFKLSSISRFKIINNLEVIMTLKPDLTLKNHLTIESKNGTIYVIANFSDLSEIKEGEYDCHIFMSDSSKKDDPILDISEKIKVVS